MLIIVCCVGLLTAVSGYESDGVFRAQDLSKMSDREIFEQLVATVNTQQKRIDGLEESLAKQTDVIWELQKNLKDDVTAPVDDASKSRSDVFPQERVAKRLQRPSRITPRLVSGTPVAFSAMADTINMGHLGANQALIMDVVNINTNNVYNPTYGVFNVPVSGVYVITSTVLADQHNQIWCHVSVNGNIKASIYAGSGDFVYDQGSQTILLHLKQGDDVTLRNQKQGSSSYGLLYTSFSGFLLYEGETGIVG